ncbi:MULTISPECIES: 3',5'-cyclic-nucleotide phosphodiesterase [unclassified Acidovorax]|jgi:ribonuclease BN (tRNA processing enzyme)|uniref:3',5'-cyclic-nucleotide phosphodiesterase n=1 Tax=unclassified Acidovorax TaxID=2684926 RepID=UPI001C43C86D|nr:MULTISPECIES: 3',5'-cyclic-nucleotide phosphodiesterase [unclassified Acidovorax]MBV7461372.1 3',5'-cyclic-nucleotide phosphodiesterase [Acidovorax sp. sif0632]MBV7466524.1 3',5'-cyclic-nucleotide phosphodiesterase [Acidovorax sp. sif0613]
MKVRVLGCSGAIAKDCRTTSFLIDDNILVDAGTGVGDLTLDEMRKIDHVFLTHSHLDHIAALPLMLDAVSSLRQAPVHIHALPPTIEVLRTHIFNNIIWPDFSCIPSADCPFMRFCPLNVGEQCTTAGVVVEALPAVHTVPAVGYAVQGLKGWWVFSGDTERNPAFWERVNQLPISMLVMETAFSERESALARRSLHLSPRTLLAELRLCEQLGCQVYITHTKPAETEVIMGEIRKLLADEAAKPSDESSPFSIQWLQAGQEFTL